MGEAHEWLVAHEAEFRSEAPEGTEYLGVFAPIFTSSKNPGDVYFVYAVDSYEAAGLPGIDIHELRHTAASLMIRAGADPSSSRPSSATH